MTSTSTHTQMLDTLRSSGEFAHGGDPETVAAEWTAARFTPAEAEQWLDSRCFTAEAAALLRTAGITPEQASVEIDTDDYHARWRAARERLDAWEFRSFPEDDEDRPTIDADLSIALPIMGRETIGYLVANNDLAVKDAKTLINARNGS